MKSLIERTCSKMGSKFASDDAVNLVLATGIVESRYEYIKQMGDGPARSFWQVEAATAVDNLAHYLKHRPKLMKRCAEASLVDIKHWQDFEEQDAQCKSDKKVGFFNPTSEFRPAKNVVFLSYFFLDREIGKRPKEKLLSGNRQCWPLEALRLRKEGIGAKAHSGCYAWMGGW